MTPNDPLAGYRAGATLGGAPVPLTATAFEVTLAGGLAVVQCTRRFRNAEPDPIEATITFPVPVAATVFRLTARIGARVLEGRVRRREAARGTYEDALDRGRAAVLHEEVLRGVHMLSVGQVPPGQEVDVTFAWAMVMPVVGGVSRLRIPLTVGEIYGRSPLPDSDDLVTGGPGGMARLSVRCDSGTVIMDRRRVVEPVEVPLNRPIDIAVAGWAAMPIPARAADGTWFALTVMPLPQSAPRLDVAVVVDRSSSMATPVGHARRGVTVHETLRDALVGVADHWRDGDRVELWEFNTHLTFLGTTPSRDSHPPMRLAALARRLSAPGGGTEIGATLAQVLAETAARDVLLVTDGKSHALDAAALAGAARGRRVSVLLVGEDSLEAQIGHLAALTGGELRVAGSDDAGLMMEAVLRALPSGTMAVGDDVLAVRGNAAIRVRPAAPAPEADPLLVRGAAAVLAWLRLGSLPAADAERLALAEGIVTAQTALVLVDEAGEAHAGVPAARKVALPVPAMAAVSPRVQALDDGMGIGLELPDLVEPPPTIWRRHDWTRQYARAAVHDPRPERPLGDLLDAVAAAGIDWDALPRRLKAGDLNAAPAPFMAHVEALLECRELSALAVRLRMAPGKLALALMARACAAGDPTAARIARALLMPQWEALLP